MAHESSRMENTRAMNKNPILYQKGSKKEPFFHAMISYRVATEALLARQLFERLLLKSFKRIPEVGLSEWPKGFSDESYRPEFANIFLDQKCLKPGENYKKSEEGGGFVGALLKSIVFVPLLSWKKEVQENPTRVRFSGSIGGMVANFSKANPNDFLDPDPAKRPFFDCVDNVLLELLVAGELRAYAAQVNKGEPCILPCMRSLPILVDDFLTEAAYVFEQLPDEVSELTYKDAADHLKEWGISVPVSGKKLKVRALVKSLLVDQMTVFSNFGIEDIALGSVSDLIIKEVVKEVKIIDPVNLFESRPLCVELDSFLSKRNCSYMTRVLAANSITSLRQLSLLVDSTAIHDLATQCSSVSSKTFVAEHSLLSRLIQESKLDEASWLLSVRLDRFIDRDASFETVIKSSSGLLISAAQKSWLTLYFLVGLAMLVIGVMSVVSDGAGGNTIFDFVASAFLFSVCIAAVFHSPKRAFLTYCGMWPAMAIAVIAGFCIDFIKNGSFSFDNATKCFAARSQLQTSFQTCVVAQIVCGPGLNFLLIILNFYQALNRQDLAWDTYLFSVALYQIVAVIFEVGVLGGLLSSQGIYYIILFGTSVIFITTNAMNRIARFKARESVAKDEGIYEKIWETVDNEESTCKEALNDFCSSTFTFETSEELLQDCTDIDVLYSQAEFINDAFQSLVSGLLETSVDKATPKNSFAALFSANDIETIFQNLISDADSSLANRDDVKKCHAYETATQENVVQPKSTTHVADHPEGQNVIDPSFQGKIGTTHSEDYNRSSQDELQSKAPNLPNTPSLSRESVIVIPHEKIETRARDDSGTARRHTHEMNGSTSTPVRCNQIKPALAHSHSDCESRIITAAPGRVRRGPVKLPYRAIAKVRVDVLCFALYVKHS
jgi:hypothetical protein